MGNHPITVCNQVLSCDFEAVRQSMRCGSRCLPDDEDAQLALRLVFAPMDSPASTSCPMKPGEEVIVTSIKKAPGWEPLTWRQDRVARQEAAARGARLWPGPGESRFGRPSRCWCVQLLAADGRGGVRQMSALLQVACAQEDRDLEKVKDAVKEISSVAKYAHRFNYHVAQAVGEEPANIPAIRVASSAACFVLDSVNPRVADAGDTAILTFFDAKNVTKFVFEGGEDFEELPQAFFHFVLWSSGGKELLADLQGALKGQDFVLVDPVLLRGAEMAIADVMALSSSGELPNPNQQRFDLWHPRCGQLCRSFDPSRRTSSTRRACGLPLNCGVGGG
ncbi:unnamed protein product [Effrenium voratum]|uniref:Alpha-type protein kinase domain-containing protein n=1 Tax=Effrenium voratum TaxID=2562239 RepID=A0AA36J5D2_9DINO|nr:unnamed protein product [Effrenium voratum]